MAEKYNIVNIRRGEAESAQTYFFRGKSTYPKPTFSDMATGSEIYDIDTGLTWMYDVELNDWIVQPQSSSGEEVTIEQVAAIVNTHNLSTAAHADIRALIEKMDDGGFNGVVNSPTGTTITYGGDEESAGFISLFSTTDPNCKGVQAGWADTEFRRMLIDMSPNVIQFSTADVGQTKEQAQTVKFPIDGASTINGNKILTDADVGAGEKKAKSISTPEGMTGQVDWILIKLSDETSLISIWGDLNVPEELAYGVNVPLVTNVDEPLFNRFVGVVNKLHMGINDNSDLVAGQMQYTGAGAAFINAFDMYGQVKFQFQDLLVLTTL